MIRSEIKNFTMNYEKCGSFPCTVPCTLFSVLKERGLFSGIKNERDERFFGEYFSSDVDFDASIDLTESDVSRRYIYIRFSSLDTAAEIYINGRAIGRTENKEHCYTVDIKPYVKSGRNTLKVRFSPLGRELFGKTDPMNEYGSFLPDAGILGTVELLKFNNAIIDNVFISELQSGDSVTLSVRVEVLGNPDSVKAVATLVSGAGQVYYSGLSRGQGNILVRQPLYWWPRGLGLQNLYRLSVNLYGEHDIEDTREYSVGLTDIALSDKENSPLCAANGVPFMPLGVIYTPCDDIPAMISNEKIGALIISLAKANCNTLVVRGGFASDKLLSLCDSHGIVVWQELPSGKEGTAINRDSYKAGLVSSLKRMAHHPSFAVIIDSGRVELGENLQSLCKNVVPKISFLTHEEYESLPKDSAVSFPSDKTVADFADFNANLFSSEVEWQVGDNIGELLKLGHADYLYPQSLSDFGYITRLLQANRMAAYAFGSRLQREHGGAALISRAIDSASTVSDAMLDYHCRPKALANYMSRFYSSLLLIPKRDGAKVSFVLSNEKRSDFNGFIYYRIVDSKNNLIYNASDDLKAPAMSLTEISGRDFTDVISGHENEYYLEYGIRDGALSEARGVLLFVKPKRFKFEDPDIKAQISGSGRSFTLTLKASAFAKDVEISFAGYEVVLQDNYFDITSEAPIKLNLMVTGGLAGGFELESALRIRSVYNIGNVNKASQKARFDIKKDELFGSMKY